MESDASRDSHRYKEATYPATKRAIIMSVLEMFFEIVVIVKMSVTSLAVVVFGALNPVLN